MKTILEESKSKKNCVIVETKSNKASMLKYKELDKKKNKGS